MKRRYVIFPTVVLVLTMLAGTFMTLFTTDFMRYYLYEKADYQLSQFDFEKARKFDSIRYTVSSDPNSAYSMYTLYQPFLLISEQKNGREIPSDYYIKGIELCKKLMALDREDYPDEMSAFSDTDLYKAMLFSDYVWLMYLNGETEKAKSEADNYFMSLNEADLGRMMVEPFNSFFSFVYNEGSSIDKSWVLETEQYIIEKIGTYDVQLEMEYTNEPLDYSLDTE